MDALEALQTRTAAPRLVEPAPSAVELNEIMKAALRAPDHMMLRPWQYLVVQGDAREKLGKLFVEARKPDTEEKRKKLLDAPMRAPMLIVAVAKIKQSDNVPALEQILSTAAGVQNMSVAIHALGYGSIWKTGGVCYDENVNLALGLELTDQIVGYLYVGTPTFSDRSIPEHNIEDFLSHWNG